MSSMSTESFMLQLSSKGQFLSGSPFSKLYIQSNPDNPATNGLQKSGRINGVAVLKKFF